MSFYRLILPSIIGNVLEWFDFSLYGYFAPIIARLFFPSSNQYHALLATFGIFAVGFLMRPLGALIFGYYGDRFGRKITLSVAVILMAIPTTLIGCLPTYEQIGILSPILLTIFRLLQGLAVGGEFAGSAVYITEHAPDNRRGMYGSLVMFSAFFGILLGSGMGALITGLLSIEDMDHWGWRIPFMMGLLLGFFGYYLRSKMPETPIFLKMKALNTVLENPIREAVTMAWLPMLISLGITFLPTMSFYLIFLYLSSYMTTFLHISLHLSLITNTLNMLGIIVLIPCVGWLSDQIGRKPVLYLGAIGFILFSYPLFLLLQQATMLSVMLAQFCFAILISFAYAAIPTTLVELFSTKIRYTGVSLSYNVASSVFGGSAPLISVYLISKLKNTMAPSFYLIFAGIIMFVFISLIKETYKSSLTREY
ncbi:MAG: MFS transporter [Legionellaceae bacterium]|nr:MFS transporter [Legionellaceae bacterium]